MKANERMASQPTPDRLVFVNVQVVGHDVQFTPRIGANHVVHEAQKIH
jgi:hypothetical protein